MRHSGARRRARGAAPRENGSACALGTVLVLVGLLGLVAVPAAAQVPLRFDLGAGIAFPCSPGIANTYWDAGYTLSAGTRWRLNSRWSFGADLGFARFVVHEDAATLAPGDSVAPRVGALHVVPILLVAEFALSEWSNTRPFLSAHLGYIRVRTADVAAVPVSVNPTPPPHPESDAFGVGIGIGVRTVLTGTADLVVDAGWRVAFSDPERIAWVPARIAVRF